MGFAIINSEGKDNPIRNNATNSLEIGMIIKLAGQKITNMKIKKASEAVVGRCVITNITKSARKHLRCFPVNFVNILGASFFTKHLWWLLLKRRTKENNSYAKKKSNTMRKTN